MNGYKTTVFITMLGMFLLTMTVMAEVPHLINYQGTLTDSSGVPITGTRTIEFSIYADSVGGTPLWNEEHTDVEIQDGLFDVRLGISNPIAYTVFNGDKRWIGIVVDSEELSPRESIVSVAYSYKSHHAQEADTAEYARSAPLIPDDDWEISGSNVYRLSGNVGIGTSNPTESLEVLGTAKVNGFQMDNGASNGHVLTSDDSGIGTWIAPAGGIGGGGTINYVPKFTSNTSIGNSIIRSDLDTVVIGNNFLGMAKLKVNANANFDYGAIFDGGQTGILSKVGEYAGTGFHCGVFGAAEVPGSDLCYGVLGQASYADTNYAIRGQATGTGFNYGVYGLAGNIGYGVYGKSYSDVGVRGNSGSGIGVEGYANNGTGIWGGCGSGFAGYFNGIVQVTGYLYKVGGGFKIDHPLDAANKYLYHSFVESPDMMNVYNGNVILNDLGEAWVELPVWFDSINKDFRYQLTCISGFAPVYIADEISSNRFRIAGGDPGLKVSWQVTGIRQDPYAEAHRIQVEVDKPAHELGKYLHPEVYGLGKEFGMNYETNELHSTW